MRKLLLVLGVVGVVAVVWWQLATATYYLPYSSGSLEAQASRWTWFLQFAGFLGAAAIVLLVRKLYPKIRR